MIKRKPNKKRKVRRKKRKKPEDIKINQTLLKQRQLFLFGAVKAETVHNLIKEMIALDSVSKKPIILYINSPGGCVDSGFALIDAMKGISSPIITVIMGQACSMGGIISIAGDRRLMTEHSVWMAHDMAGGVNGGDYTTKTIDRVDFMKREQKKCNNFLRKHTKLSEAEIRKATDGELWLQPEECLKKGIIDKFQGKGKK